MNNIVKFEIKKFFKNKKNIISIIIYIFLIVAFIGYSSFIESLLKTSEIDIHKENYLNSKKNYNTLKEILEDLKNKNELSNDKSYNKQIEELSKEIDLYNEYYLTYEELIKSYEEKNIDKYLKLNLKRYELDMEFIKLGYDGYNKDDIESEINLYTKLIELKTIPIDVNWSLKGLNFIKNIFMYFNFIIVIFTIILFSDLFSGESKNKTYKILLNQPISKSKIYFGKIIGGSISTLISILMPLIIFFGILSIFKGSGHFQYPIKIISDNSYNVVSMGMLILKFLILIIALIIFTISLTAIFSIVFDSITLSMITPIGIYLFLENILFSAERSSEILNFFPITITKVSSIIYDYDFKYKVVDLNFVFYFTIIYSLVFLALGLIYFNKYKRFKV